ncbi:MAG: Gfo/Idh/MocA family oxidoreductase, partial [Rhizobiales bacterium]|nr:Gfo/Idh/MocA family oxidoreductase [Hyphomicrobiales bacterium]
MRTAIVGLGWWGQTLVNAGHGKGVDFVLGTSRTKNAKAQEFCQAKGIKIVEDYDTVLSDSSIDAVVLATPHSMHGDQVRKAAAAGKHVFIEKPFTLTAPDAASAIDAMKKAGKVLAVGFNRRFHPNMAELKARVKDGRLGDIVNVIGEQSGTAAYVKSTPQDTWRATSEEAPAGAMTGIGIHTLDSMIGLFGPLDEVHCIAARRAAPHVDDTTAVLLRFKSGLPGLLFYSFATAPTYRMAVFGSKGLAEITKPSLEDFRFTPAPGGGEAEASQKPGFDTVNAELVAFAEAASGGKPYPIPTDEILQGVQGFEAIVK